MDELEHLDDTALIRRSKAGDGNAFGELYRRYRTAVLRLAGARLGDPAAAEEVTQDTFLRALLGIERFDEHRPFGPWVNTIAANLVIDEHRRRDRMRVTGQPARVLLGSDTGVESVLAAEGVRSLKRAIESLPPRQRRILIASVLDDLDAAEVAELENISESSVASVVYRARLAVRRHLRRLAIVIILLRISWRRAASGMSRSTEAIGRLDMAWTLIATSCALSVFLLAGPEAPSRGPSSGGSRSVRPATSESSVPRASAALQTHERSSSSARHEDSPAIVRIASRSGPRRDGAVGPSTHQLRVEIVGPDGQVLHYEEVSYSCDGMGSDALPDDGPVRATC